MLYWSDSHIYASRIIRRSGHVNNHGSHFFNSMNEEKLRSIILNFIHSETGWGNPLRPGCEFEDLFLNEIERLPDGRIRVVFRYVFDEDGFSQYDKGHVLEGMVLIDKAGGILESTLEETYTGPATVYDRYGGW